MEIQNLVFSFDNKRLFFLYINFSLNWFKYHFLYNSCGESWNQQQIW